MRLALLALSFLAALSTASSFMHATTLHGKRMQARTVRSPLRMKGERLSDKSNAEGIFKLLAPGILALHLAFVPGVSHAQ
eukprot:820067-Rhodomonas_salina.1